MKLHIDVLKERIADRYDIVDVVDILGLSVEDLLDAFEDLVDKRRALFDDVDEDIGEED